jgi:hypothetical protein
MRNSPKRCKWITLFARLVLALSVGAASIALADDQSQPAQQPAAPATDAPPQKKTGTDDDEGADYEKNATKRFTPTERTPADRNVSFPVDI